MYIYIIYVFRHLRWEPGTGGFVLQDFILGCVLSAIVLSLPPRLLSELFRLGKGPCDPEGGVFTIFLTVPVLLLRAGGKEEKNRDGMTVLLVCGIFISIIPVHGLPRTQGSFAKGSCSDLLDLLEMLCSVFRV